MQRMVHELGVSFKILSTYRLLLFNSNLEILESNVCTTSEQSPHCLVVACLKNMQIVKKICYSYSTLFWTKICQKFNLKIKFARIPLKISNLHKYIICIDNTLQFIIKNLKSTHFESDELLYTVPEQRCGVESCPHYLEHLWLLQCCSEYWPQYQNYKH